MNTKEDQRTFHSLGDDKWILGGARFVFHRFLWHFWQQHPAISWRAPRAHANIFIRCVWVLEGCNPQMAVLPTNP
eukprot:2659923-Lingulodinium_polyedra.AAC.1